MTYKCGVCVNPRTRRSCGKPAVGEFTHPVLPPTPACRKHFDEWTVEAVEVKP